MKGHQDPASKERRTKERGRERERERERESKRARGVSLVFLICVGLFAVSGFDLGDHMNPKIGVIYPILF